MAQSITRPKNITDAQWNQALELYYAAKSKGDRYPELTVAQAALETGWFKSPAGRYNYFGQKATSGQQGSTKSTKEVAGGKTYSTKAKFRDYSNINEAVDDRLSKWGKKYKNANNVEEAIGSIWRYNPNTGSGEGYATDTQYGPKLKTILGSMGVPTSDTGNTDQPWQQYRVDTSINLPTNTGEYQTAPEAASTTSKEDLEAEQAKAELLEKQREKDFLAEVQARQDQDSERRYQQEQQAPQQEAELDPSYYQVPQIELPNYEAIKYQQAQNQAQIPQEQPQYKDGGGIPQRYKNMGFTHVGQKKAGDGQKKWKVLAKKGDKYKVVQGGYRGMKDFSQHGSKKRQDNFWSRMGGRDSAKANDPFSPLYWHKRLGKWEDGGEIKGEIECTNCGWSWDKSESTEKDMYNCHKCGGKSTGESISQFQEGGVNSSDLPDPVNGVIYDPNGERTYYDDRLDRIVLTPSSNFAPRQSVINHEKFHKYQFDNLGSNYEIAHEGAVPLFKKPSMVSTDEEYYKFHNRKGREIEQDIKDVKSNYPEFTFVQNNVLFDKIIDREQYSNPYTLEGEAQEYENSLNKFQEGGNFDKESTRDNWVAKTGLPWSEAKRLGYTDGTKSSNIELLSKLKSKNFEITKDNKKMDTENDNEFFPQVPINPLWNRTQPVTKKSVSAPVRKAKKDTKLASNLAKANRSDLDIFNDFITGNAGNNQKLQNGVITDKRTNLNYVVENGVVTKTFPVLTALNPDVNVNDKGVVYLDKHPESRGTPRGTYLMNPKADIYGEPGFRMDPVPAFGEAAPKAKDIATHVTYPGEFKQRNPLYAQEAKNRYASYGCVNCRKPDLKYLTDRFKKGDTTIVIDSNNRKDADFLGRKLFSRR